MIKINKKTTCFGNMFNTFLQKFIESLRFNFYFPDLFYHDKRLFRKLKKAHSRKRYYKNKFAKEVYPPLPTSIQINFLSLCLQICLCSNEYFVTRISFFL